MPRSAPSSRPARPRAIYAAVVAFYVFLFFAVMWPIYPRFATIEPRVFGMPHGLFYVVGALVLSFAVLLGLFLWEEKRGLNAPLDEDGDDR